MFTFIWISLKWNINENAENENWIIEIGHFPWSNRPLGVPTISSIVSWRGCGSPGRRGVSGGDALTAEGRWYGIWSLRGRPARYPRILSLGKPCNETVPAPPCYYPSWQYKPDKDIGGWYVAHQLHPATPFPLLYLRQPQPSPIHHPARLSQISGGAR